MRRQGERTGVLLINLGTPDSPDTGAVRRYLRVFLMDPRVIDIPTPRRWLLVNLLIAPFRAPKSAAAYRAIWGADGSPLLANSRALEHAVAARLGGQLGARVGLAMRYGRPSIAEGIAALGEVDRIVVVPLYPQYASSSTGTALEAVYAAVGRGLNVPRVEAIAPFFDDPGFLDAQAALARPVLAGADHVLFSFHSLPERQVKATAPSCALTDLCCAPTEGRVAPYCYRAQCLATARGLAARLVERPVDAGPPVPWSVSFQSRLGREEWLKPATDLVIPALARQGVRRLVVLSPSFVADCLETVAELGIRGRAAFLAAGGEELRLVPCVNASEPWVAALSRAIGGVC